MNIDLIDCVENDININNNNNNKNNNNNNNNKQFKQIWIPSKIISIQGVK